MVPLVTFDHLPARDRLEGMYSPAFIALAPPFVAFGVIHDRTRGDLHDLR
jgi:hypothetical protein